MKKLLQYLLLPFLLPVAIGMVLIEMSKKPLYAMFSKMKVRENVSITLKNKAGETQRLFKRFPTYKLAHLTIPFVTGMYVNELIISNLITNTGIAGAVATGTGVGDYSYIGLGTGTTAAIATDTTLETESVAAGLARAVGAQSNTTTTIASDTLEVVKNFTNSSGSTVNVSEFGLFNAASAGTMMARVVETAVPVTDGSTLGVTWKIIAS